MRKIFGGNKRTLSNSLLFLYKGQVWFPSFTHTYVFFLHHCHFAGEMVDRKYDWSRIPKESKFGVETPHNNDGIHVRKTLKWLHETQQ